MAISACSNVVFLHVVFSLESLLRHAGMYVFCISRGPDDDVLLMSPMNPLLRVHACSSSIRVFGVFGLTRPLLFDSTIPNKQLLSYGEMLASATNICSTLQDIPCIGDGDTGYGNALNVKRTVKGYAQVCVCCLLFAIVVAQ